MTHIATDISYLFPETENSAITFCGKLVKDVILAHEYVCISAHIADIQDEICQGCKETLTG